MTSIAPAGSANPEALRVGVVEWLPLHTNREVIDTVRKTLLDSSDPTIPKIEFTAIQAFGDEKELKNGLLTSSEQGCNLFITFGNFVTEQTLESLPDSEVIGVLIRDASSFLHSLSEPHTRVTLIDAEPSPWLIWETGKRLCPDLDTMGILYTSGYSPNEHLAKYLSLNAPQFGGTIYSATVGVGNCRTVSDFERALDKIPHSADVDVLFLPDDPNGSRFSVEISRIARSHSWKVLSAASSSATDSAATFIPDYTKISAAIIQLLTDYLSAVTTSPNNLNFVEPIVDFKNLSLNPTNTRASP